MGQKLGSNNQYKGVTLCLEEKSIPSRKRDEHFLQQDKKASWFIKGSLILSASDNECFKKWDGD